MLRRLLPCIATALAVALVATDWPLDWTFWIDHPFVAALAAGLVLLLLTGSVVDVILRRREAKRWTDLGRGAAYALDQVFWLSGIAMFQLLGARPDVKLTPEIELQVGPARTRAIVLLGRVPESEELDLMAAFDRAAATRLQDARLPGLLRDPAWCDHTLLAVLTLARVQETTIARWVGAFGVLGDSEGFRRIGESTGIADGIESVVQHLLVIRQAESSAESDVVTVEASTAAVRARWAELVEACTDAVEYWESRHAIASSLGLSEYPITTDRMMHASP